MSNLATLIKTINAQIVEKKTSFVYYEEESGKILKISNRHLTETTEKYIEVGHEEIKDLLTGKRRLEDFYVDYDLSAKNFVVKEHTYEDDLDTINFKLYELPVQNKFTACINNIAFQPVYEGVEIYLWTNLYDYEKNALVWYNNNVYKVKTAIEAGNVFNLDAVELYIKDVYLVDLQLYKKIVNYKKRFEAIYEELFIDVWYKELKHIAGQHVWYKDAVYRYLENQEANTEFNLNAVELIVDDVKMYDDENKSLNFFKGLFPYMKLLDNNRLFLYVEEKEETEELTTEIEFYVNSNVSVLYKWKLFYIDETNVIDIESKFKTEEEVNKGDLILIGKNLFIANPADETEHEILVRQNYINNYWSIHINRKTKRDLIASRYKSNDVLYFSITAKHDPNILYRTIKCSLRDLIHDRVELIPFKYDWEFNKQEVSVYTPKFFNSYIHEIIE
jgi:hypothetical protein